MIYQTYKMIHDNWSRRVLLANFFLLPLIIGPFFINFFRDPKWVLLYFSTLLLLPFTRSIPQIKVPKLFIGLFLLIIIYHFQAPLSPFLLDMLCFTLLCFVTYNVAQKSPDNFLEQIGKFNLPATILVLCISYLQLFKIPLSGPFEFFPVGNFTSFFGNTIFTGEFLALSCLLLLYGWETQKKKIYLVLIFLSLILIYYLFSRMVILGIILAYFIPRWKKKIPIKVLLPLFLILGALAFTQIGSPLTSKGLLNTKRSSFDQRWSLVLNSLAMIKDRPFFGFGPGRFSISYIPYRNAIKHDPFVTEHRHRDDPHSGPLRVAVEFGLPFALMILFLWSKLFGSFIKRKESYLNRFLLGVLIFYTIDFLFGFPWLLPYPFFFAAVCLGIGLSGQKEIVLGRKAKKIVIILSFLLIGFRTGSYSLSRYLAKNYPNDFTKMGLACKLTPYMWENCYQRVKMANRYGKYNEVIDISKKLRSLYPGHSAFIKSSAIAFVKKGQIKKACDNLQYYEKIVGKENSLKNFAQSFCND
ncbi:MAG: hypothetical protein DRQ88_11860 [Epsilonproteobacteria bacterium]|nr:MAG: hypothetical protein DRQ89_11715 [Campylobacterota bacterium]RLA63854.1 MAG: hypothetical protein DRQ88_11860 [Campylobacterota bacterium]